MVETRLRCDDHEHTLTVLEQHQLRIARKTLKMAGPMVAVMGGMSLEQAKRTIRELGAKYCA